MRRLEKFPRFRGEAGLALLVVACASSGCAGDFDTTRVTPARGSLGRELFTVVCDRVGAQALREDITGASYRDVCHADATGAFASVTVDASRLPPLDPVAVDVEGRAVSVEQQQANRDHRIARIEALARRRDDLILAFDSAFTNETLETKHLTSADPQTSCEPEGEADLQHELGEMLGRLAPLYDDDTIAHFTRGLSRMMEGTSRSPDATSALARFDARQGYRPRDIANGVIRPLLSYPRIVELANGVLPVLSTGVGEQQAGKGHEPFTNLLAAVHAEFAASSVIPQPDALQTSPDATDPTLSRLNRPRGNLEMARSILLEPDAAFAIGRSPQWIVQRDPRGFARVALDSGRVPAPFVDETGPDGKPDGLPDVDRLGRFITDGDAAPSPFLLEGEKAKGREPDERTTPYEYVDVSKTFLASLVRDLVPLLDSDPSHQHETVMDAVAGLAVVAGAREKDASSRRSYTVADGKKTELTYRGFRAGASPLLDLVHAVGQFLADSHADDTLALLYQLANDKPNVLARVVGIGLELKRIADLHPEAHIPESSTFWDEMLDVVVELAAKPKLIEDLLRAFEQDATVDLRRSARAYLVNRDELTYDRANLNGPTFNLTTSSLDSLVTPVDRRQADIGTNRSAFQRFLQVLHDLNGVSICTKPGAVAHIKWKGLPLDFPSIPAQAACVAVSAKLPPNPAPRCGLFRIKNIAEEIINAFVGEMRLDIRDDCLRTVLESPLTGIVGGSDALLEEMSGIKGFKTHPTIPGLARIMYFEVPNETTVGDLKNPITLNFLRDLFDEHPTLVCPRIPFTDTDGAVLNVRQCASRQDGVRVRDSNALFPIEQLGFLDALKPIALAFRASDANVAFVDLFDTLHRHWGSAAQPKDLCDPGAPTSDARWCTQDGMVSYEPLLAEVLATDLFPTLQATVKELSGMTVEHCTDRDDSGVCQGTEAWDGVKVIAEAVKALVDPKRNTGLKRRTGAASVTRNDGTTNPQVTPIYLFIDALKGFDQRLRDHASETSPPDEDRTPLWRRARSQIVDQLLTVEGTGADSKFSNRAFGKALPRLLSAVRSQLAAHCPDPVKGCYWARTELAAKATETVTGPTFAGLIDTLDAIRSDENARTELERLLVFLLSSDIDDTARTTISALADLLQVFEDDESMTALMRAAADIAAPEVRSSDGQVVSRGLISAAMELANRIVGEAHDKTGARVCSSEIDPNRALAVVLRKLVAPGTDGAPSPIDVLLDVVTDVNRLHPEVQTKLDGDDYGSIAREVAEFCSDPSRGLEQVYTILKQATKAP